MVTPSYFRTKPPAARIEREFHKTTIWSHNADQRWIRSVLKETWRIDPARYYITEHSAEKNGGKQLLCATQGCFCSHWALPEGPIHIYNSKTTKGTRDGRHNRLVAAQIFSLLRCESTIVRVQTIGRERKWEKKGRMMARKINGRPINGRRIRGGKGCPQFNFCSSVTQAWKYPEESELMAS